MRTGPLLLRGLFCCCISCSPLSILRIFAAYSDASSTTCIGASDGDTKYFGLVDTAIWLLRLGQLYERADVEFRRADMVLCSTNADDLAEHQSFLY
ncbi:hypothetical protein CERSUDRAFT_112309 [Gelatoporia subvermispora B]|uniref:Uncharacterized protein n=1 Tax=Ceriporiopsis subvermispora (strain B) TaxID=914234 RepID=M2RMM2_CERS8|nr:hypothetical protein CERSUDRAFT_112309 [Gelatoporia subvermispora B]